MKSNARNTNLVCVNCGAVNGDPRIWLEAPKGKRSNIPNSDLFYGPHEERFARPRAERPFYHYADTSYSTELLLEQYFDPASPKEADILALDVPMLRGLKNKRIPSCKFDRKDFDRLVMELLESGVEPKAVVESHLWQSAPAAWRNAFVKRRS